MENVTHEEAVQALKMTDQTVILLVEKAKKDENDGAFSQPVVTSSPMPVRLKEGTLFDLYHVCFGSIK